MGAQKQKPSGVDPPRNSEDSANHRLTAPRVQEQGVQNDHAEPTQQLEISRLRSQVPGKIGIIEVTNNAHVTAHMENCPINIGEGTSQKNPKRTSENKKDEDEAHENIKQGIEVQKQKPLEQKTLTTVTVKTSLGKIQLTENDKVDRLQMTTVKDSSGGIGNEDCGDFYGPYFKNRRPLKPGTNIYGGYQIFVPNKKLLLAIKTIRPYEPKNDAEVEHLLEFKYHPNIVQIVATIKQEVPSLELWIVMERCSLDTLQDYVKKNLAQKLALSIPQTTEYTKHLIEGMKFIHKKGIIHRDLKPDNILFSLDGKFLKIADFGLSKRLERGCSTAKSSRRDVGTDGYRAPETYLDNDIKQHSDIFSLGLVIHVLWTNGDHPFGPDPDKWRSRIKNEEKHRKRDLSKIPEFPKRDELLELLIKMLQFQPRNRPSIRDVSSSSFFDADQPEQRQLGVQNCRNQVTVPKEPLQSSIGEIFTDEALTMRASQQKLTVPVSMRRQRGIQSCQNQVTVPKEPFQPLGLAIEEVFTDRASTMPQPELLVSPAVRRQPTIHNCCNEATEPKKLFQPRIPAVGEVFTDGAPTMLASQPELTVQLPTRNFKQSPAPTSNSGPLESSNVSSASGSQTLPMEDRNQIRTRIDQAMSDNVLREEEQAENNHFPEPYAKKTIGPGGGELQLGQFKLDLPPMSMRNAATIYLNEYRSFDGKPLPEGYQHISSMVRCRPTDIKLGVKGKLTVPLSISLDEGMEAIVLHSKDQHSLWRDHSTPPPATEDRDSVTFEISKLGWYVVALNVAGHKSPQIKIKTQDAIQASGSIWTPLYPKPPPSRNQKGVHVQYISEPNSTQNRRWISDVVSKQLSAAALTELEQAEDEERENLAIARWQSESLQCSTVEFYESHLGCDDIYQMKPGRRKGCVLIINNEFRSSEMQRSGSSMDVKKMTSLWGALGFDVVTKMNLSASEMVETVREFASIPIIPEFLATIIMTHGGKDEDGNEYFIAEDGRKILRDDVIDVFTSRNSSHLRGIPKIFIFQACRGGDGCAMPRIRESCTSNLLNNSERSDILIACASQSGCASYRNSLTGSWFINAINDVFRMHAHDKHVSDMLIRVNSAVANETLYDESGESAVQIANQESYLRKKLYLFPGWPKNNEI